MRLAFVLPRAGGVEGGDPAAHVAATSRVMAEAGHRVAVVGGSALDVPAGVELVTTRPDTSGLRYFTADHAYADGVFAALRELDLAEPLHGVLFAGADGVAGFTAIQARRLLGALPGTRLLVRLSGAAPDGSDRVDLPTTYEAPIRAYMADYCLRHADGAVIGAPLTARPPAARARSVSSLPDPLPDVAAPPSADASAPPRIAFPAAIHPWNGFDVFARAAAIVLREEPSVAFEVPGPDTPSDPFGESFRRHALRGVDERTAARLVPGTGHVPPTVSVFPFRWEFLPRALLTSMAGGGVPVVSGTASMRGLVTDGVTGLVVDPLTPEGLARALLRACRDPAARRRMGAAASAAVQARCDPAVVVREYERCFAAGGPGPRERRDATSRRRARPLVSVVIPHHDQGAYLHETVDSVRASSYPHVEILVVDDGSTDPSSRQAFSSLEADRKVAQPNRGLAAARNAGIAAASGPLVLPLDADDLIDPRYIELAVAALARDPEVAYVSCYTRDFGLFDGGYVPVGPVPDVMLYLQTFGSCANVYRREALEQVGGYDEQLIAYENWDLLITLTKRGLLGDVLPLELFRYRRHRSSMVFTLSDRKRVELLQFLARKHADVLSSRYLPVVLNLLHLWKSEYEPDGSARFTSGLSD
ncbi:MAG TPA: glycosyltransferase [Mycobacteriales bacterium]